MQVFTPKGLPSVSMAALRQLAGKSGAALRIETGAPLPAGK